LYRDRGDERRAIVFYTRALEIMRKSLASENPEILRLQKALAECRKVELARRHVKQPQAASFPR
jgi:hypothetical protein